MGNDDKDKSGKQKKGSKLKIVFWGLVLIALYVFSVGPVQKFCSGGKTHGSTVMMIYVPLEVLSHHSRPADQFFGWYVRDIWRAGRWEV